MLRSAPLVQPAILHRIRLSAPFAHPSVCRRACGIDSYQVSRHKGMDSLRALLPCRSSGSWCEPLATMRALDRVNVRCPCIALCGYVVFGVSGDFVGKPELVQVNAVIGEGFENIRIPFESDFA